MVRFLREWLHDFPAVIPAALDTGAAQGVLERGGQRDDIGGILPLPLGEQRFQHAGALMQIVWPGRPIHHCRDDGLATRPSRKRQTGIGLAAAGENEHERPIAAAGAAFERRLIETARRGQVARMSVNPNAGKLRRLETAIHAAVEEIGDRGVQETDADAGHFLADGDEVLDVEEVVRRRNAEAADLGVPRMAEILEFEPGERGEGQAVGCSTRWQVEKVQDRDHAFSPME